MLLWITYLKISAHCKVLYSVILIFHPEYGQPDSLCSRPSCHSLPCMFCIYSVLSHDGSVFRNMVLFGFIQMIEIVVPSMVDLNSCSCCPLEFLGKQRVGKMNFPVHKSFSICSVVHGLD